VPPLDADFAFLPRLITVITGTRTGRSQTRLPWMCSAQQRY